MKIAALSALIIGSASAFAPAQTGNAASSTALNAFETELGSQKPLGFWDPIGMLREADQARFDRLRYTEVKHGRVAMLAFIGNLITRAGIHLPGNIDLNGDSFDSYPDGWEGLMAIPDEGVSQIIYLVGFLEACVMKDIPGTGNEFPGDLRNGVGPAQWDKWDEATKLQKRGVELNNGRAAMMGILGLMVHEQLHTNLPIVGQM